MGGVPDLVFVVDVKKEALAVAEANKLGIPVVAVVDTNCSPSGVNYMIPGNDDASRAIGLYCDLISRAALDGMSAQLGAAGVDLGEMDESPTEEILTETAGEEIQSTETAEEESQSTETSEEEVKKSKEDDKKAADKVEVTTKKSKAVAKKPKATTKKTTASKAKKKDEGKASESAPVEDKKTKVKEISDKDTT